ncbi:alkaline phosphatase [Aquabacterium fontiphilum]|uniref:5'-nucleotidase C-terminal domain-containing protein n=1 Tax=Aquabacterium fontiphilum TaxID=450365 RepID=UPI001379014A|nr:5'-nucleotidase C-terminal domain-containing protein [Aquabacterium fontiphilum]NBD21241.1 alkaline phosphatase [Aquabacterium fontiphilum]
MRSFASHHRASPRHPSRHALSLAIALGLGLSPQAWAEGLTVLHVGDQESWLLSAQGNLRDDASQAISFYGGVDRLAAVIQRARQAAQAQGRSVLTLNAGDAFLPGPRFTASTVNLAAAHPDGGQDYYDAIALRRIGFDAIVFGNHEFDLGSATAARFAAVSGSPYLSVNLNFQATPAFAALAAAGKVAGSTVVQTAGGKKVGIVGATTPLLPVISSPAPGSMLNHDPAATEAQNLQAIVPLIQSEVNALRASGVGTVILLSHLQNAANERNVVIPALTGVDLVVSGGGHELMADPDDLLINGGVAAAFNSHPVYATDASGKAVPVVTSHFGNRYVGEVNLTLDDTTGALVSIDSTRMHRVSGAAGDADRVTGDSMLQAQVVAPVGNYIAALNRQIIGQTAVKLNGPTHVTGTPGNYVAGVRNAETGLGNLVADAMRLAGQADVAIQNGGGIRTSIAAPGPVSVGDTFNILPFTNLVKRAPAMNAAQLKDVLEHAYGATSPAGAANGRFAQVSGMQVTYDSAGTARTTQGTGARILRVVLDDGTVLIDGGRVVNATRSFSFATIDFTANGGDGYPFAANGVVFDNATNTITYQEALAGLISTPKREGGLRRDSAADGPEITANLYGPEDAFDLHGRLIDVAVGQTRAGQQVRGTGGRDVLVGTAGDDTIEGGVGADLLTGGPGGDTFVYRTLRDIGDTVTDFTPYADRIDLRPLLLAVGYSGSRPVQDGWVRVVDTTGGVLLQLDADGPAAPGGWRTVATLQGLTAAQFAPARDLAQ